MKKSFLLTIPALAVFTFGMTLMTLGSSHARVIIKERTTYYNVSGKTGAQLFASISKRGPKLGRSRHVIATMTSDIRVKNIKTRVTRSRCSVKSVDVIVNITYRYPRWRGKKRASPAVRKAWDRFIARAIKHEKTHGKIAKQHGRDIEKTVRRFKGRVSKKCTDFARGAERKFARLSASVNRKHDRFDRREASARSRSTRLQIALFKAR